jgi:hypothetical protein
MPNISLLDFLRGIMLMFNAVIYRDSDGVYYVERADDFYTGKSTRDITRYVDDAQQEVLPPVPFDDITFKFSDPDTFLIKERIDRVGEVYGDESYSLGTMFEDNDFEVEVPFEKILFERMTDISDDSTEVFMWAWCVTQDTEPYVGAPIIFHADDTISTNAPAGKEITWEFDGSTSNSQIEASNYNTSPTPGAYTLTFGSELVEYSGAPVSNDLFQAHWENYVTGVYDAKARVVKLKAWLPASFILDYDLGDTIRYRNKEYFINEITIDVRTGETELELITKWL